MFRTDLRENVSVLWYLDTIEAVLNGHSSLLSSDLEAYRNHVYRVANLCAAQVTRSAETIEKIAIAAVFHDLGIWTDRTFDYLKPSADLARAHLQRVDRTDWIPEVTAAILEHHKVLPYDGEHAGLVEPFRRADWMDVSCGFVASGLPRGLLASLVRRWPRVGFHRVLVRLELQRLRTHPWSPLPMVKW